MAIIAKKYGKNVRVSKYETVGMMTLKDIYPGNKVTNKEYLIKTKSAPSGAFKDLYHVQDNSSLVRKIFREYLFSVLEVISTGKCAFKMPNKSGSLIYLGYMNDKAVQYKAQKGQLKDIDLLASGFKVPYLTYCISKTVKRQELKIFVPQQIYQNILEVANENKKPSKIPYEFKYFLEPIFTKYNELEQHGIQKLILDLLRTMGKYITRGQEIRMVFNSGEIRFFRPLGNVHDRVMRELNKKYNKCLKKI